MHLYDYYVTYMAYYYDDCYMYMQVWCNGTSVLSEDINSTIICMQGLECVVCGCLGPAIVQY